MNKSPQLYCVVFVRINKKNNNKNDKQISSHILIKKKIKKKILELNLWSENNLTVNYRRHLKKNKTKLKYT